MFAHNDNNTLIASSMDGSLSVYKLDSDPPEVEVTLKSHTRGVTDFDISVSNELVVSCSADGTVCLWRLSSDGEPEASRLLRQVQSTCRQGLTSCRFLPCNNNLVVVGSAGGLVQLVNISTGTETLSRLLVLPTYRPHLQVHSPCPARAPCLGQSSVWPWTSRTISSGLERTGRPFSHSGRKRSFLSLLACSLFLPQDRPPWQAVEGSQDVDTRHQVAEGDLHLL